MRFRPLLVAVVSLAAGLVLFVVARGPVRGLLGDVLVVVFLDAALASVRFATPVVRLGLVGALAVGVELLQLLRLVGPDAHWLLHLTVGSTFDPLDLSMYVVGLGFATLMERRWLTNGRGWLEPGADKKGP